MYKYSLVAIFLVTSLLLTFSMAISSDWIVYINNKPFNGLVSVSNDVAMGSIEELSGALDFTYEYNNLTDNLKINGVVYAGPRTIKNDHLMVSLSNVAAMVGAKYELDSKVRTVTIQTFHTQLVPTPAIDAPIAAPTPQGPTGDEVQVKGLREMTEGELYEKDHYSLTTIGLTGTAENTVEVKADKVVVTVYVKDGDGAIQDTLTADIGTLEPGVSKDFDVYFNDYSIHYDQINPALVFRGINWQYETDVTFELEEPAEEADTINTAQ